MVYWETQSLILNGMLTRTFLTGTEGTTGSMFGWDFQVLSITNFTGNMEVTYSNKVYLPQKSYPER